MHRVKQFRLIVTLTLLGWTWHVSTLAQTVEILAADQISRDPNITEAQRLIGHVKLGHQDAVLTCDSAWRFDDGKVEVFGDVVMRQPPATTMNARYVVIQPGEDWARARKRNSSRRRA